MNASAPAKKFKFVIRRVHEFRPRNGSESDSDFMEMGFNSSKDNVVASYDFQNATDADIDPILDMGTVDIYSNSSTGGGPSSPSDTSSFRHITRVGARFGPGRIARAILTFVATNIKNSVGDGEVSLPGGLTFTLLLENIPYRKNGSSIAVEVDFDSDDDAGVLVANTSSIETDSTDDTSGDSVKLEDNTEGQVQFNDTRRIRWKRRVFCEGNKTVIVKMRYFTAVGESADSGFTVRKKLVVTFHIPAGGRCSKLLWDPATDIETVDDTTTDTTATTASATGSATTATTASGSATTATSASASGSVSATTATKTSDVSALCVSFIVMMFALMF